MISKPVTTGTGARESVACSRRAWSDKANELPWHYIIIFARRQMIIASLVRHVPYFENDR